MARPLPSGKQSVSLESAGVRGSKIRRDPPPAVKEITVRERNERDAWVVAIGILTFTIILLVIAIGIGSAAGWTPREYTAHL